MDQGSAAASASEDVAKREWVNLDSAIKEHALEEVMVNIGECAFGDASKIMMCMGLGSCVGVAIYDSNKKIAGLAHVMLPSKNMFTGEGESPEDMKRFADVAVPYLVESLLKMGSLRSSMLSKISGGAQMFKDSTDELFDVGKRNVLAVKKQLLDYNIHLVADDVYGNEGRTIRFVVDTSKMLVRTKNKIAEL